MFYAAGEITQTVSQKEKEGQTKGWEKERESKGGRKRRTFRRERVKKLEKRN